MSLKDLLKRRVGTLSDWIQEGQGGKKGGSGQSVVTKSETDDDLQSYTSLKSLLDGYGVDTSQLDKNRLDYTYLNGVTDKDGNPLSRAQKREASISLFNYLQDAQALRNKNLVVANAENTARKDTAYQSMLSEKLRKYLGAAEDATGQTGYTGVTQGNRIALANQEAARHQAIQETRDVNVNNALANYINSVNENGRNALEQNTALWASLDAQDDTDYQNYLAEVQNLAANALDDNGQIKSEDYDKIGTYIDGLNISDQVKKNLKNYMDTAYSKYIDTQENVAKRETEITNFTGGKDSYKTVKAALDDNKDALGEEEYNKRLAELNKKMSQWVKENIEIKGLSKTLEKSDDIDLVINGKTFDLLAGKRTSNMDWTLNTEATGSKDVYPDVGTIVAYNGKMYLYKKSRYGENWHELAGDGSSVKDAYAAYTQYDEK